MATEHPDVLIVGGGAVALCTAYYLQQAGVRTLIVERRGVGTGCSYGNGGLIFSGQLLPLLTPERLAGGLFRWLRRRSPFHVRPTPWHLRWLWHARQAARPERMAAIVALRATLLRQSQQLTRTLIAEADLELELRQQGLLVVYRETLGQAFCERLARAAEAQDIPFQRITQPAELVAGLRAAGGLYFEADFHLHPARFVQQLYLRLAERGVRFRPETEVLDWERQGRRIVAVRTGEGRLAAGAFVLAAGAWSGLLARKLGLRLPIAPVKGYSLSSPRLPNAPEIPLLLADAGVTITPLAEDVRVAGGLELVGFDLEARRHRAALLYDTARAWLPEMPLLPLQHIAWWRGLRPCMPDELPALGRPRFLDNLVVATGGGLAGLSLAAVMGYRAARLILAEKPDPELEALRPDRFH